MTPRRPWFQFSLRTLIVAVLLVGCGLAWLGLQLRWLRDRQQARAWLGASKQSWYAPSMGGKLSVDAPWSMRLFGEPGVVGIGLDVDEFLRPTPYDRAELERLFPEARVEVSRDGRWIDTVSRDGRWVDTE